MVQLADADIQTREVLDWQGVHLFHFASSSCSQKTRIFLNLKGIEWESHPVDLMRQQNYTPWFLGINPRGLVPVLVHDGVVHIESNDILMYEVSPEAIVVEKDTAVVHYNVTTVTKDSAGKRTRSVGRITEVLVRNGRSWKWLAGVDYEPKLND